MRWLVALLLCTSLDAAIKRVAIVHLSHYDVGFTDHPAVARQLQKEYIDLALDAALSRADFRWTVESILALDDWWKQATPARRELLLGAVGRGQIAVAALPCNNTPFLNQAQWQRMLHWIPDDLWNRLNPEVAVQNDVNGFPRAGALALLDRGVQRLFMGLNADQGGPPFPRPTAFWWRMPDGRRMMVYLGDSYPAGYSYFHTADWRRGPVPAAADTAFRRPREGDFFRAGDASLERARDILLPKLKHLEEKLNYRWETLIIPFSNQWRMDNDPPFPAIAEFVAAWNRKGLKPELELTTAAAALAQFEDEAGASLPEYAGEWTDWWANGTASAPREVAASRAAKRYLEQAPDEALYKELCLFDEHTWGSSLSVARPDALDSQAQFNAKAALAFHPFALAQLGAARAAQARVAAMAEGLYVVNTAPLPYTGWVDIPVLAFRASDPPKPDHMLAGIEPWIWPASKSDVTPENDALLFRDARPTIGRFWVSDLAPNSVTPLKSGAPAVPAPPIATDKNGWPTSVQWKDVKLESAGFGDFVSVAPVGEFPRVALRDLAARKPGKTSTVDAVYAEATREETPHTVIFRQRFGHPSLKRGLRVIEIWKATPRVQLRFNIYRLSSESPETFYAAFPLPVQGATAATSSGGATFTPFTDQLPGTCRDHFAIDCWIHYKTAKGDWLWVTRDAPLIAFDKPAIWERRTAPVPTHRVLSMLFSNFWYTNFAANQNGVFEYQFDLEWSPRIRDAAARAQTLTSEPWVVAR